MLVICIIYNFSPFYYYLDEFKITNIDPDLCYCGGEEHIKIYGDNFIQGEKYFIRIISCRKEDNIEEYREAKMINNNCLYFKY